jgi:hypothetical protein
VVSDDSAKIGAFERFKWFLRPGLGRRFPAIIPRHRAERLCGPAFQPQDLVFQWNTGKSKIRPAQLKIERKLHQLI